MLYMDLPAQDRVDERVYKCLVGWNGIGLRAKSIEEIRHWGLGIGASTSYLDRLHEIVQTSDGSANTWSDDVGVGLHPEGRYPALGGPYPPH